MILGLSYFLPLITNLRSLQPYKSGIFWKLLIKKTNLKIQNTNMRTFALATLMSAALSIKMRACEDTNENGICDEDEFAQQVNCWVNNVWVCEGNAPDLAQVEA